MDDSDSEREAPKRASLVGMLPLMAVAACCILLLLLHSHNHRFDKAHHVGPKAMNRTASICRGHRYFCSDLISLSNLEYIIASVSLLLQLCLAWLKPYMGRWNSRPSDSELFIHTVYTCLYYQRMPTIVYCIKHPGPLPKARNTTVSRWQSWSSISQSHVHKAKWCRGSLHRQHFLQNQSSLQHCLWQVGTIWCSAPFSSCPWMINQ